MRRALRVLGPHLLILGLIPAVRGWPGPPPQAAPDAAEVRRRADGAFAERQEALRAMVQAAAADATLAAAIGGAEDDPAWAARREAAFGSIARRVGRFTPDEAGLLLLAPDGRTTVAWAGRTFELAEGFLEGEGVGPVSALSRGPSYGRVAVARRLGAGGSEAGWVAGFLTLEVEYPFRNQYLRPRRPLEEAVGVPGVEVRLSAPTPGGEAPPPVEAPYTVQSEGAGRAAKERASTERQRVHALGTAVLLALSLAVFAAQLAWSRASRPARAVVGTVAIVAARVAVARLGVDACLLPDRLVDAGAYASAWGDHPADLFENALVACAAALLLARGIAPPSASEGVPRRSPLPWLLALLVPATAWGSIRAVASVCASAVQDGTVPLFDLAADPLDPLRLTFDLAVLLSATAALALCRLAGLWGAWGMRGLPGAVRVPIAAALLAAGVAWACPGAPVFGVMAGAAVLPAAIGPFFGRGVGTWVLLPLCAALLVFPPLEEAQSLDQHKLLDSHGAELADSGDEALVSTALEDYVRAIAASPGLPAALEEAAGHARTPDPRLALSLWQEGDLARKAETCYLGVRSAVHPQPDSEFSFGLPREWIPENPFVAEGDEGFLPPRDVPFRRAQVRRGDGKLLGEVLLALLPRYRAAAPGGRASLLRAGPARSTRVSDLVVSEYGERGLSSTESSEAPVPPALPPDVREELGRGLAWRLEAAEDRTWETLFVVHEGARRRVYALSRRLPSPLERFQSFLRFFLVFALAGGLTGAIVLLVRAVLRRAALSDVLGRLQAQLFAAFVLLALVPILALAVVHQRLRAEESREEQEDALRRVVDVAARECQHREDEIIERAREKEEHTAGSLEFVLKANGVDLARAAARIAGADVVLYANGQPCGSSRQELFQTELLPSRMDEEAYREVVLLGRESHVVARAVGDYRLRIGYQRLVGGPTRRTYGVIAVPELEPSPGGPGPFDSTVILVFGIYALVVTAVWLGSAAISRRIAAPVEAMTRVMERAAAGDLSARVPARGTGELADLVESLHRMLEDLAQGREALAKAEREAAWRGMARTIAHEIKNPLTPLKLSAQHLARAYADGAPEFGRLLSECVEMIVQQVDLLGRIASDFSYFARLPDRRPQETDLNDLARGCAQLFASGIEERIEVRIAFAEGVPPLYIDPDEWRRVLTNLIKNAIEAMEGKGVLSVETERGVSSVPERSTGRKGGRTERTIARPWVEVRVRDSGTGLPEEVRAKLFQPYITTKLQGTGLGLAIVKKSVDDAGGTITLESAPGRGTTVRVRIPYGPGTPVALPAQGV